MTEASPETRYGFSDIECIDAIRAQLTHEQYVGFLRGQIAKYNWRIGRKGEGVLDAQKIAYYSQRLIFALSE